MTAIKTPKTGDPAPEPSSQPAHEDVVQDADVKPDAPTDAQVQETALKALLKQPGYVAPLPKKSLLGGKLDPFPDSSERMMGDVNRMNDAANIHEFVAVIKDILPYWNSNRTAVEFGFVMGTMKSFAVIQRRGKPKIPAVPTSKDPLDWMDWVTSAEGAIAEADGPVRLITLSVAVRKYRVSKSTLTRMIGEGKLTDHRLPDHLRNAAVLLDDDVLGNILERRPQK